MEGKYDQQSMRPHLLGAIDKRQLQPFPTQGKRKPKKPTVQRVPIYCVCRLIDDGSQMIECNCCGEWFHTSCIKVEEKYVTDNELVWTCRKCIV